MDNSITNFELSASTVRVGSESDKSSEKSDTFEDLLETDTSTEANEPQPPMEDFDHNLPDTVTLLRNPETGFKVYLVGTAHFSKESQDDVIKVIRTVQPHVVVLELCSARTSILSLDEATVLQEATNINFEKVMTTIRTNGAYNGVMYLLLLNMSAYLTKEIGMAPGGEFRVAYQEAQQLPKKCGVHLGDRPIQITLKRALARLSWFQTIKLGWHLLTSKEPISKEEIERCKRRDMLEQLLAEMAGEYPALGEVFVDERDIYLTHALQMASSARLKPRTYAENLNEPLRVVGVVGIGHAVGITRLWPVNQAPFVANVLKIPPQSLSSKVFKITVKISLLTFGGYLIYRHVPVPTVVRQTYQSVFDKVMSSIRTR